MPWVDLTVGLRRFLGQFSRPFVLYDHPNDGKLFRMVLNGVVPDGNLLPTVNETLVLREDIGPLVERYFKEHPEEAALRHHAGVDTEALRWACVEATRDKAPSLPTAARLHGDP